IRSKFFITSEDVWLVVNPLTVQAFICMAMLLGAVISLCALALLGHSSVERVHVYFKASFRSHFQSQINRESISIVQLKSLSSLDHRGAFGLGCCRYFIKAVGA